MQELVAITLRISVIYLYVLGMLRLSGKRSISSLSAMDFVVAAIVGDMFDNVIWGDLPFAQGLVGFSTVIIIHTLLTLAKSRSSALHRLVAGSEVQVVGQGKVVEKGLAKERTSFEELWASLREQGKEKEKLGEIKSAFWEPSGQISVILQDAAGPVQKQDLPKLKELRK